MADDIRAHANYIGHSPQKVRLVIDLVRGRGSKCSCTPDFQSSELCNG
jgi:hypothetical protein